MSLTFPSPNFSKNGRFFDRARGAIFSRLFWPSTLSQNARFGHITIKGAFKFAPWFKDARATRLMDVGDQFSCFFSFLNFVNRLPCSEFEETRLLRLRTLEKIGELKGIGIRIFCAYSIPKGEGGGVKHFFQEFF